MSEKQTCGRRMSEPGPWKHEEGLDRWESDRWLLDPEAVRAKHAREDAEHARRLKEITGRDDHPPIGRGPHNDLWLWPGQVPRTCSFCGSIHPEDALRLLDEGWEIEVAKSYKAYLNPPGYRASVRAMLERLGKPAQEQGSGLNWAPTPPVKLYMHHCTDEQIERLNDLLQKAREGP